LRIAYLRGEGGNDEIQTAMKALETAGCDRVVFDSTPRYRAESRAALLSFLAQMKEGDDLVVTNLDQLASTTSGLIETLASLASRGITVETITGEIDTADPATSQLLATLWKFQERSHQGRKSPAALIALEPGPGRPRRLATAEIAAARAMIDGGRPVAEIARELSVSRATLYRSLKRPNTP
jgi:DNA invertase Pin-like site-specific DNA recombinase